MLSIKRRERYIHNILIAIAVDIALLILIERLKFDSTNFIITVVNIFLVYLFPGFILLLILLGIETIRTSLLRTTLRVTTLLIFLVFNCIFILVNNIIVGDVPIDYTLR